MTLSGKSASAWVLLGLVALAIIVWRVRVLRALVFGLAAGAALGVIR
jgi:hypothetical protein